MTHSLLLIFLTLLAFIFAGKTFYVGIIQKRNSSPLLAIIPVLFWVTVALFALFPQIPQKISEQLGLGENLNTLIFFGFIVVFFVLLEIVRKIDRVERSITDLARHEALKDLEK